MFYQPTLPIYPYYHPCEAWSVSLPAPLLLYIVRFFHLRLPYSRRHGWYMRDIQ